MSNFVLHNIHRSYPTDHGVRSVLTGFSLDIASGELVCLVGPSGCGKSTVLRIAAGLDKPDSGTVYLDGRAIDTPGPDRVLIFQDTHQIFPWLRVINNIEFALWNINRAERRRRALALATAVGLESSTSLYPYQLSGGMRQRVALARALAAEPAVLLMDEPFAALDAAARAMLHELLSTIRRQFKPTILFVTHHINEAESIADRVVVMSDVGTIERITAGTR